VDRGTDLADIIASSDALNEKPRRQPQEKSADLPAVPSDAMSQPHPTTVQRTGVELTPWQLATRRAKRVATCSASGNGNRQNREAVGVTMHSGHRLNDAAVKVQPSEAGVRRRWGNEEAGAVASDAKAPSPPLNVQFSTTSAPSSYSPVLGATMRPMVTSSLKVSLVGDSGLQLNKSKGTSGFESDLRLLLGPNVEVVRFPGEGAEAITRYLHSKRGTVHVAVAVWFLNELFNGSGQIVGAYPPHMDHLAMGLADALKSFPFHIAVIGGAACLWKVSGQFDIWAERARNVVSEQGVCVVDGLDCYSALELKDWHARSTPENKTCMASYFANLVMQVVAESRDV